MTSALGGDSNGATERQLREVNEALLVSSIHQHELAEQAQQAEAALRHSDAQLRAHVEELSRFNRVAVGRELRMIEMKQELNELAARHGEVARYPLDIELESAPSRGAPAPPESGTAKAAGPLPAQSLVPLESILCTEELNRRPARPPDYQEENRALGLLAKALADSPRTILQTLADTILEVFQADSAGLSLLTTHDGGQRFYWPAIAGAWKGYVGGGTPRDFGPCGDVLDCNAPLLFKHFERRYSYLMSATPAVVEALLIPFHVQGQAVGTIWAMAHDERRRFDAEDLRQLESLGRFASAAYQATHLWQMDDSRRAALNLMEDAVQARQRAEKLNVKLRESEERYRALFELGPVAVYSCDASGVIREFNRRAAELWGRVPALGDADERFCGSFRMIRPDGSVLAHAQCPMADVLCGAVPYAHDAEVGIERPDGSRITVVVNIRPLKNEQGEITGAINCFYDITERKQMEQQLRASEERYRTLIDQVKDYAIFRTDVQGRALTWNQGVQRILGFGEAEFLGQDIVKVIFAPEDVESGAAQHELDTAAVEGTAGNDRWMRRRSGERFFANGITTALKNDSGELIGFTKVMRDMTGRRQAEAMIRCQKESLELLLQGEPIEQVLDLLARSIESQSQDGSLAAIHLMEPEGHHFGYVAAPSLPSSYAQMTRRMDARLDLGACSAAVVSHQPTVVHDFALETRWPGFTAELLSLGLRGCFTMPISSPLPEPRILGTFALYYREPREPSAHDRQLADLVTHTVALAIDRTQAEDHIKRQAEQLADESRRKDEFLAMLSHELRNPLASIVNATQLLRLQQDRNPIQVQAHGLIDRQVAQLVHLVDDLLEVSRISTGRIRLNTEHTDLRGVVQRAIETIQPRADRKGQSLEHSLPGEPLWVNGDPMRLEQVAVNLIDNAVKYTDTGGAIRIALQLEGHEAVLRVRDTGVGIAPNMLPRIFDLFTQADRSLDRAQGGLGIGLALVQSLVAMHRGRVEAHSTPGEGSEFIVALPTLRSPDASAAVTAAEAPASAHALKVLVVDDNIDAAQTVTMLLQAWGHDARVAHDGREAMKAALEYGPDVVLLDIGLPAVDGLQVAKQIRGEPALKNVVLVALTGYGQESDRQHSQAAGFNHHLVKPVDFTRVARILAGVAADQAR